MMNDSIHTGQGLASWCTLRTAISVLVFFTLCFSSKAAFVSLFPSQDSTIYDTPIPLSNSLGQYLFAGNTGPNNSEETRRALLAFDVAASLPSNAELVDVELRIFVSMRPLGVDRDDTFTLHRAETDWGEGSSAASGNEGTGAAATLGDPTWESSVFDTQPWNRSGGDFQSSASATLGINGIDFYRFSDPGLIADVEFWLTQPDQNFGWFLLGDETGSKTVRRFDGGNVGGGDGDTVPQLQIEYVIPEPASLLLCAVGMLWVFSRRLRSHHS